MENKKSPQERKKEIELLQEKLNQAKKAVEEELPKDFYAEIPKKTAALEVIKHLKNIRLVSLGAVIGVFLILLGNTFNLYVGYGVAALVIIPSVMYAKKAQDEIIRLQKEYGL